MADWKNDFLFPVSNSACRVPLRVDHKHKGHFFMGQDVGQDSLRERGMCFP